MELQYLLQNLGGQADQAMFWAPFTATDSLEFYEAGCHVERRAQELSDAFHERHMSGIQPALEEVLVLDALNYARDYALGVYEKAYGTDFRGRQIGR
jgi:hypothetical protein